MLESIHFIIGCWAGFGLGLLFAGLLCIGFRVKKTAGFASPIHQSDKVENLITLRGGLQ